VQICAYRHAARHRCENETQEKKPKREGVIQRKAAYEVAMEAEGAGRQRKAG